MYNKHLRTFKENDQEIYSLGIQNYQYNCGSSFLFQPYVIKTCKFEGFQEKPQDYKVKVKERNPNTFVNFLMDDKIDQYKEYIQMIKNYCQDALDSYTQSNHSIRDLLYRMNAMDPIERENMNRGFKLKNHYDAPYNHTTSWLNIGRDDTVITGLMNHEIVATFLYLCNLTNISINVLYNVPRIVMLAINISKYMRCFFLNDNKFYAYYNWNGIYENELKDASIEEKDSLRKVQPNLRYMLLQSKYDGRMHYRLKYAQDFSKRGMKKLLAFTNSKTSCFGDIKVTMDNYTYNVSIERLLLNALVSYQYGHEELSHNMVSLPLFNCATIYNLYQSIELSPNDNARTFSDGILYSHESIRRIMHITTICVQQSIMFGFIDYIRSNIDITKLSNPIDERLWRDRDYQYILLQCADKTDIGILFKSYMMEVMNTNAIQ